MNLRVLTYNIHKGFSALGTRYLLAGIKDAIDLVAADVVLIQEVHGTHADFTEPQLERLADRMWPHFAYGKNAVYEKGDHGNAVLSKFPIVKHENIDISTNTMESRGLLHAEIEMPGGRRLHLFCLHLSLFESGRRTQFTRIADRMRRAVPQGIPMVVAGDFNDWREKFTKSMREELGLYEAHEAVHGKHARTFPAAFPMISLDRIYARDLKPLRCEAMTGEPWKRLSDHAALFAEFEISE